MSSSEAGGGRTSKDTRDKKRLGRVLSRAKGFLRRSETASPAKQPSAPSATSQPIQPPSQPRKPATAPDRAAEARARYEKLPGVMSHSRAELLAQRAQSIKTRFDLDIDPADWQAFAPSETVLRVDRPIRMRVRRSCHRCDATFTSAKECPVCQHKRCNLCIRHPPKLNEDEKILNRERKAAKIKHNKENAPIVADWEPYDKDAKLPKVTKSSKSGRQDLLYKKPRQRVRRTCHECSALFITNSKTCPKCGHARCTDCPRDPPKKAKYPFGYPGDEFGPNSVPHFECTQCDTVYPTGAEHGTKCDKCGTEKSDSSKRAKPRKVEPAPKPEVLASLQDKLDQLKLLD